MEITEEMKKFFKENGKKGGKKLLAQRGPEYFKRISAMRKVKGNFTNHPKRKIDKQQAS